MSYFETSKYHKKYLLFLSILVCFILSGCSSHYIALKEKGIYGRLYKPGTQGYYPAVILLHGTCGPMPADYSLAKYLSQNGYITFVIDYYAETGIAPGLPTIGYWKKHHLFISNIVKGVSYLQDLPEVVDNRIGFIGYSRGGGLAYESVASGDMLNPDHIKCIVSYYGGTPFEGNPPPDLPPSLLLIGGADMIIPPPASYSFKRGLEKAGNKVEMYIYNKAKHGFNRVTVTGQYNYDAAADARQQTLDFLDKHLKAK